jgi:hypothetical protein
MVPQQLFPQAIFGTQHVLSPGPRCICPGRHGSTHTPSMQVEPWSQQQSLPQVRLPGHGSWIQVFLVQVWWGTQHCVLLAQALAIGHSASLMRTQVPRRRQEVGGGGGLHLGSAFRAQSIVAGISHPSWETLSMCKRPTLWER